MSNTRVAPQRIFERDDARRVLPLVRAIVADLADLQQKTADRDARLNLLISGRDLVPGDPYADELQQMREDVATKKNRMKEYQTELRDLGVVPDSLDARVVRFPSQRDGKPIWLCWRLGEVDVEHWCPQDPEGAEWILLEQPAEPT